MLFLLVADHIPALPLLIIYHIPALPIEVFSLDWQLLSRRLKLSSVLHPTNDAFFASSLGFLGLLMLFSLAADHILALADNISALPMAVFTLD